jgi:5-methyltetrahydrofolate--homocysteine methyltransferase
MMRTYHTYRALKGLDESFASYIRYAETLPVTAPAAGQGSTPVDGVPAKKTAAEGATPLQKAIIKGLKEQAATLTAELLAATPALTVVQSEIIPALDIVGQGFERKTTYLPQLLMAAEAAKAAFEVIKSSMTAAETADNTEQKMPIVLATVKGDIHDIGKNIVKLLLENYGYPVTDLGRDVPPEAVVEATVRLRAPLVGLSALMTTTVPAMEETIQKLRTAAPWCKIVVGGAVLTEEYAASIGADKYAKDAMETVRYAETFLS